MVPTRLPTHPSRFPSSLPSLFHRSIGRMKIFINEQAVSVEPGTTVGEAVRGFDPSLAEALHDGSAYATDGVGRRIDPSSETQLGGIIRVVRSARRAQGEGDAR